MAEDGPAAGEENAEEPSGGGDEGFLGSIQNWLADAVDNVGNFVDSATDTLDEAMDDAVRASEYYTEQFALLLVTTCIMPILVLLLLWWVIRMLFSIPQKASAP